MPLLKNKHSHASWGSKLLSSFHCVLSSLFLHLLGFSFISEASSSAEACPGPFVKCQILEYSFFSFIILTSPANKFGYDSSIFEIVNTFIFRLPVSVELSGIDSGRMFYRSFPLSPPFVHHSFQHYTIPDSKTVSCDTNTWEPEQTLAVPDRPVTCPPPLDYSHGTQPSFSLIYSCPLNCSSLASV